MDGQSTWETIAGRVVATAGPLVAAAASNGYGVPGWAPAALAATATAGMALRGWRLARPWSERAFQAAAGVAAGSWLTWSTITGPWHLLNLVVGAGAAVLGMAVAPAFVGDNAPAPTQPHPDQQAGQPLDLVMEWKQRIERIAKVQPVEVLGKPTMWPNDAGFTMQVAFAAESGDGWDQIDAVKHRIARAARLPKGCVLSVSEGDLQGTAVVRVPTVYVMDKELPLPEETTPMSVWDDHAIGGNEDTTPATINLRQAAALIGGQRGAGKSNLQKVIISRLLRCNDSLIWVADLNGGGLAVPFMLPYAEGRTDVPPIDWVAASPEEAVIMARVASAIVRDRKARYAGLTARSGGDLLPVSRQIPQITIVVDESAELEGNPVARKAMDGFLEVLRIGRADAVNIVFSALRATQDTIPVPVRKQTSLKFCAQVEDTTEMDYILAGAKVKPSDLQHPGTMFMRRGDQGAAVRQIKVFRGKPEPLGRIAVGTSHLRPTLDLPGQQVGGRDYADRMLRLRPWLDALAGRSADDFDGDEGGTELAAAMSQPATARPTRVDGGRQAAAKAPVTEAEDRPPLSPAERDELRQRAREGLRRLAARGEARQMPQQRIDDTFAALMADVNLEPQEDEAVDEQAAAPDGQDTGWLDVLLDIIRESGPIGPTAMAEALRQRGISKTVKTLHDPWLPRLVEAGKLEKVTVNGKAKYQIR